MFGDPDNMQVMNEFELIVTPCVDAPACLDDLSSIMRNDKTCHKHHSVASVDAINVGGQCSDYKLTCGGPGWETFDLLH